MNLKRVMAIGLTTIMILGISCSKSRGNSNENVLVYGSSDYTSINPALYEHGEINSLIFSGLTGRDKDNKIVPALAKSWEYNKDRKIYTFTLREDVKWHDGKEFTAEDVKFTLETIMNPKNSSEIASNYEEIEKVNVKEKYKVEIVMKEDNVALLDYLTVGMLPKHLLEGKDISTCEFNTNPIGTGPYKLEKWDKGQSITLAKNDQYYKKTPAIDKIIFKILVDSKGKAIQLKSGELDLAQVTPKDYESFKDKTDFNIYNMKTADYRGILYNFNSPIFKENKGLPNALSYGIDRQAIVDAVLLGEGEVAYSPIQMGAYNNSDINKFEYNPKKAIEEIEKLGWKKGADGIYEKNGNKLSFEIVCQEGDQVRVDIANICAQNFKEIGVEAKVKVNGQIDWESQDGYLIGWGSPFDPDDHTYKVFGSNKGSNFSAYSNSKVDELLTKARETEVQQERIKLYKDFQVELSKDLPYTFICYINAIYVSNNKVKGITTETILGHHGVGIFYNVEDWTINE